MSMKGCKVAFGRTAKDATMEEEQEKQDEEGDTAASHALAKNSLTHVLRRHDSCAPMTQKLCARQRKAE